MDFRKLYRRILPVSKEAFHTDSEQKNTELRALNEKLSDLQNIVSKALEKQTEYIKLLQVQRENLQQIENKTIKESEKLQQLIEQTSSLIKNFDEPFEELIKWTENQTKKHDRYDTSIKDNVDSLNKISKEIKDGKRYAAEAVWAGVYHDTIIDSTWLSNKKFSPGRWAIGYPVMYVLYRVLDEFRPRSILELGLGQSTKMISQYVAANEAVIHKVVEHDTRWINFFKNGNQISEQTEIIQKDLTEANLNGKEHIRCYEDFEKDIVPGKYDLIFIDAPIGGDMPDYARIDILKIIPQSLKKSFVIILDDFNRSGEKNMVNELLTILDSEKIQFHKGIYAGEKEVLLITNEENSFLCSM